MLQLEQARRGNRSQVAQSSIRRPNHRRHAAVCYSCSVDLPRPAVAVRELLALFILKNVSEAEIGDEWRHPAEVTWSFVGPTSVCVLTL
jgi:hypothetical protein